MNHTLSNSPALAPPHDTGVSPAPMPSDVLLQASRRVDWRFLLPDPNLGRVGCVEPVSGSLVDSLRLFSASLRTIGDSESQDGPGGQFDVVVASDPSRARLQRAVGLVMSDGYLYIEVHGLSLFGRSGRGSRRDSPANNTRLRLPGYCAAHIEKLGFAEVTAHWHWPDFESCTKIVPLDNRAALGYTFSMSGRGTKARLRANLGRWLMRSGLLTWSVPCFSIVARRVCA